MQPKYSKCECAWEMKKTSTLPLHKQMHYNFFTLLLPLNTKSLQGYTPLVLSRGNRARLQTEHQTNNSCILNYNVQWFIYIYTCCSKILQAALEQQVMLIVVRLLVFIFFLLCIIRVQQREGRQCLQFQPLEEVFDFITERAISSINSTSFLYCIITIRLRCFHFYRTLQLKG